MNSNSDLKSKLIKFPSVYQDGYADCGAETSQKMLLYYGDVVRKHELAKMLHTTYRDGTTILNIIKTFKRHDLKCDSRKMTINDLINYIDQDIPVMMVIQAWSSTEDKKLRDIEYETKNAHGHYVIALGYKYNPKSFDDPRNRIRFADPWVTPLTRLYFHELEKRWHDVDIRRNKKGEAVTTIYDHHGIAVYGKPPTINKNFEIYMG